MAPPKKIALFLDGTWNVITNNTNVWRLKTLCEEDETQIAYYSAGVGTQVGSKVIGGALGYGINQEVIDAYSWLIEHYNDKDEIFIFGFSRGAYTARSLAGLISKAGLAKLGSPLGVGELFERYKLGNAVRTIRGLQRDERGKKGSFTLQEKWLLKYSKAVPIKFMGVWDTVGALGIPFGKFDGISTSSYNFLETDLRINESFAYHALAIDEHRKKFAPTFWSIPIVVDPNADKYPARTVENVEQRWFVGAHADVGGGYSSNLLSQPSLKWIMDKAISHGLKFREIIQLDGTESVESKIHDSYAEFLADSLWGIVGWIYRLFNPPYNRPIGIIPDPAKSPSNINETIDASVFQRWREDPNYRPKNLVEWANRQNIDPKNIQHAVRADTPSVTVQ